ncbi:MAG: alanine--glyoxylate aminotransferase family protein [Desulfobacterales bacterium]|nr:MAG: alanine--glyoxylate aminotransferase family protein [Desulfobacterales bacterium]
MQTYPIPMVPGPVKVPEAVREVYRTDFGSADLESEFLELYQKTEANLKQILGTGNQVVMQSGEGMLGLWSALKSCLRPGDRVLAIATGVFGDGIAEMAGALGAQVRKISLAYNETISDLTAIEKAIVAFQPKMITAVHCETPSGTLNPLAEVGRLKKHHGVPLLYVDAVASAGGTAVRGDAWHIDLCLGGSQKCLSSLPNMAFVAVSDTAWEIIDQVNYMGYDALKPFQKAPAEGYFPYTPYWHGVAGLNAAAELILREGLPASFARHAAVAEYCRTRLTAMGLALFPAPNAVSSPTVTAVQVPGEWSWPEFDARLRRQGLVVGGSYGQLAGRVFRLGHMGTQANMELVKQALDVIERVMGE